MAENKRRISILGSTGSIGLNSVEVLESLGPEYEFVSASAHSNWKTLAQQARKYSLEKVVITDTACYKPLKEALADTRTTVLAGKEHLCELATDVNCDTTIVSVVGVDALEAVQAATKAGKTIALANKESLVVAGCVLMPLAKRSGAKILPIDSEHSAILQAMHSGSPDEVEKIIVTCSGGPFRRSSLLEMADATVEQALAHPTWDMGQKITIDSATTMNKALEIIEARWLFDVPAQAIEVLIHPESIIHSLVEFCDGSVIAQLSSPDMRLPIQYALTYPKRLKCPNRRLNLQQLTSLNFEKPDLKRFPALRLGFEVAQRGGTAGAVLNAANEAAVEAFLARQIKLTEIAELTEKSLDEHNWLAHPDLDELLKADNWAREYVNEHIRG